MNRRHLQGRHFEVAYRLATLDRIARRVNNDACYDRDPVCRDLDARGYQIAILLMVEGVALACRAAGGNAVRAGLDQPFDLGRYLLQNQSPAPIERCRHGRDHTRRSLGHRVTPIHSDRMVDFYPVLQDNYPALDVNTV